MELHPSAYREPFGQDLEILRFETFAERSGEDLARLAADQRAAVGESAAMGERFVGGDVAALVVLDEEDGVGDAVEKLNPWKRTSEGGGKRRRGIGSVR